jgi:putative endonuclease
MPSPTQAVGAAQEMLAERALVRLGYVIAERNWRGAGGEIDRICWDREVLVFVEIRGRAHRRHGDPSETVRSRKQRLVIRTAEAYLQSLPGPLPPARFDVVGVVGSQVEIYEDAFEARP